MRKPLGSPPAGYCPDFGDEEAAAVAKEVGIALPPEAIQRIRLALLHYVVSIRTLHQEPPRQSVRDKIDQYRNAVVGMIEAYVALASSPQGSGDPKTEATATAHRLVREATASRRPDGWNSDDTFELHELALKVLRKTGGLVLEGKPGRPRNRTAIKKLIRDIHAIYEEVTGNSGWLSRTADSENFCGPFHRFLTAVFHEAEQTDLRRPETKRAQIGTLPGGNQLGELNKAAKRASPDAEK